MANTDTGDLDLEKVFYRMILTVKRFIILIAICLIIGGMLGYLYSNVSKKIYGSKMLISSYVLTNSYAHQLVDNLNLVVQEGNLELLQSKLKVSPEVAGNIVKISAEAAMEDVHALDEKDRVFVKILVQMKDASGFRELEEGLLFYLENNEYAKNISSRKKAAYEEAIRVLDKQIADLETSHNNQLAGKNSDADPGMIGRALVETVRQKIETETDLATKVGVHVVDGFTAFSEPQWPRRSTSIGLGLALGVFVAFVIIIIKLISERMAKGIDNL
jgi:hypothetical protein